MYASSLSNRIFLGCTLLTSLSLGLAFWFVNARAVAEAEAELERGVVDAARLVDEHRASVTATFTTFARLVADLPKLKAAVETDDPPTVQPIAEEYRRQVQADLLIVSDAAGTILAAAGAEGLGEVEPVRVEPPTEETSTFATHPRGILQIVSVPILLGVDPAAFLGRLAVGFFLDDRLAAQFKALTASDIAFAAGGRVLASTLPPALRPPIAGVADATTVTSVRVGDGDYLAVARPLHHRTEARLVSPGPAPVVVILRSRTERLRFLNTVRTGLAGALMVTVLLATVLSYGVARTVTRPLAAVTGAMRDVAATGDLTRKVALRSGAWDDADARLLATAFNTLTDSISRFQRDAAQKERLTALGRLSTVVAHEIRNPLMIIRTALSSLRREPLTPADLQDAVADIDDETRRLNRIVADVLDFAKPIRFDHVETDLNAVCQESAAAAFIDDTGPAVALDLDAAMPPVVTDSERLRRALVNLLTNARQAVQADGRAAPAGGSVIVRTRRDGDRARIVVADTGVGISTENMAHIFDPYFTTRRAGTGLGLPIARNIVEGLGGALTVQSHPGQGTHIEIDLPLRQERS